MLYDEATFFEGYHFAHIVAWENHRRLELKRRSGVRMMMRKEARNG